MTQGLSSSCRLCLLFLLFISVSPVCCPSIWCFCSATQSVYVYRYIYTMASLGNPKAIVFSDWDGTITLQDSNDYLTDNLGFGYEKRKRLNDLMLEEKLSFSEGFDEMLKSINVPFDECIEYLLQHVQLDPGFKDTYEWCYENQIPIIIISSGMKPIIEALLKKLVSVEAYNNIEIISNDVKIDPVTKKWEIVYRDSTPFGHDKSLSIKACIKRLAPGSNPYLFYCGDGVSDLSAGRETHFLFAKRGKDLVLFCQREGIPYKQFDDFSQILDDVKAVVSGEKKLDDCVEKN